MPILVAGILASGYDEAHGRSRKLSCNSEPSIDYGNRYIFQSLSNNDFEQIGFEYDIFEQTNNHGHTPGYTNTFNLDLVEMPLDVNLRKEKRVKGDDYNADGYVDRLRIHRDDDSKFGPNSLPGEIVLYRGPAYLENLLFEFGKRLIVTELRKDIAKSTPKISYDETGIALRTTNTDHVGYIFIPNDSEEMKEIFNTVDGIFNDIYIRSTTKIGDGRIIKLDKIPNICDKYGKGILTLLEYEPADLFESLTNAKTLRLDLTK